MIIRVKTTDLFASSNLTEKQRQNSELNKYEIENNACEMKSYPQRIVLELTSACNLKCIMCGRNYAEFKPTFFNIEWLKKIEPLLNYVEEVTLIGWGEPTTHPKFVDILKYLNEFPVRKFMCTNGMMLDKLTDAIFDYKLDLLTISLDGANAKTNEVIRQGSDFNKIIKNIEKIVKMKEEKGVNYPYISTTSTIMKSNLSEFPEIVKLGGEIGIQEAKAIYLTSFGDSLSNEVLYGNSSKVRETFEKASLIAEKYDMKLKLPFIEGEDTANDNPHKDCYTAWRDFFFSSDGYIRPCMSTPIKLLKFEDYDDFFDLWNSEEMVKFRENVNCESMPDTCKKCYQASYANWNKKHSFLQEDENFSPDWEK